MLLVRIMSRFTCIFRLFTVTLHKKRRIGYLAVLYLGGYIMT